MRRWISWGRADGRTGENEAWRSPQATPLPRFEADRCVHAMLATATCTSCIDACPRQALELGEDSLQLDVDACDGCGLCRPACSERAIEIDLSSPARHDTGHGLTAFASCAETVNPGTDCVLPCLHALGLRELDDLSAEGVTRLVVTNGDCASCTRGTAPPVWRIAEDVARSRRSKGLEVLEVTRLAPAEWKSALERAGRRDVAFEPRRRSLLGLGRARTARAPRPVGEAERGSLYAVAPIIDEALCTGCDACVRICPHEALILSDDGEVRAFASDPTSCTGCGLCLDVCSAQAVRLEHTSSQSMRVRLTPGTCRKCGVAYHRPSAQPVTDRCPICTAKRSAQTLFLVKDRREAER